MSTSIQIELCAFALTVSLGASAKKKIMGETFAMMFSVEPLRKRYVFIEA
jgi:hypothetical protein